MNNRVLIINDSKFESMVLSDMLSSMGYNVKVTDEYDALRLVQVFSPDVVLVNYVMKDTFGDQLIERIKMKSRKVKCILTSNNQLNRSELRSDGIEAIVRTPVNKIILQNVLKQFDAKKEEAPENDEELVRLKASIERWKTRSADKRPDIPPMEAAKGEAGKVGPKAVPEAQPEEAFRFCPYCGGEFEGEEGKAFAFCPYCGHRFKQDAI